MTRFDGKLIINVPEDFNQKLNILAEKKMTQKSTIVRQALIKMLEEENE